MLDCIYITINLEFFYIFVEFANCIKLNILSRDEQNSLIIE